MKNFKIALCIGLTLGWHQQSNSFIETNVKTKKSLEKPESQNVSKPGAKSQELSPAEKSSISNKNKSTELNNNNQKLAKTNEVENDIKLDNDLSLDQNTTATKKTGLTGKMNYLYKRGKEGMQAVSNVASTVSDSFTFSKPETDNSSSQVTSNSPENSTSNLFSSSKTTEAIKVKDTDSTTVSKNKLLTDKQQQSLATSRSAAEQRGILDTNDNIINTFKEPGSVVTYQSKPSGSGTYGSEITTDLSDGTRLVTKYDSNGKPMTTKKIDMNNQKTISIISHEPFQNVATEEVFDKNGRTISKNTIDSDGSIYNQDGTFVKNNKKINESSSLTQNNQLTPSKTNLFA